MSWLIKGFEKFQAFLQAVLPAPAWRALKWFERFMIEVVLQKIIGGLALFLLYFFVLGPTSIWVRLFARRALRHPTISPDSNWVAAKGYDASVDQAKFQS
ncbi:MAG TPA: hypothetical protein PLZ57_01225 [Pseudobdellovibrionaceae bacterium]|nr:hypothetical protein [Pseudobdellovibrionaceae bacterium]